MDKEPSTTQMDHGGQENGKIVRRTDLELNTQQMEQYLGQETGWMVSMWD